MSLSNIKKMKDEQGFTIVELLIVIIVIGILAALVIVAYNGVVNQANGADAKSAAATIIKKAEAYNSDTAGGNGSYPVAFNDLNGAASTATWSIAGSGITLQPTAIGTTKPATAKTINFYTCGANVGIAIGYWNYSTGAVNYTYSGGARGTNGSLTTLPSAGATCTISTT